MFPYEIYQFYESATVADPDLQIPDSEIRAGGLRKKNFFWPFMASFWSKNKGGGDPAPPGPHPWIHHCANY